MLIIFKRIPYSWATYSSHIITREIIQRKQVQLKFDKPYMLISIKNGDEKDLLIIKILNDESMCVNEFFHCVTNGNIIFEILEC